MGCGEPFTVDSYEQKIQAADLYPLYMHIKILSQAIVKMVPTKTEQDEHYMPLENFRAAIPKAYA